MKGIVLTAAFLIMAVCSCTGNHTAIPASANPLSTATTALVSTATLPPMNLMPATRAAKTILMLSNTGPGSSDPLIISETPLVYVDINGCSSK